MKEINESVVQSFRIIKKRTTHFDVQNIVTVKGKDG